MPEQPVAVEPMPDVISVPEIDAGSSTEEAMSEVMVIPPPIDTNIEEETAELNKDQKLNPGGIKSQMLDKTFLQTMSNPYL